MAVKSALRVLQILEHFDDVQRALTALQVSAAFAWPRSSAWGLLRTLHEAGYLSFDPVAKTYLPTERVSVLALWAYTPLFREGQLLRLMHELRRRSRGRIVLAAQTGSLVRYIHTVQGARPGKWHFRRGAPVQMLRTSVGRLFLSLYPDGEALRIVHHLNAQQPDAAQRVAPGTVLEELKEIRATGYSVSLNRMGTGHGAVSMLLPRMYEQSRPLAIGIMCRREVMAKRHAEFAGLMRDAILKYLAGTEGAPDSRM